MAVIASVLLLWNPGCQLQPALPSAKVSASSHNRSVLYREMKTVTSSFLALALWLGRGLSLISLPFDPAKSKYMISILCHLGIIALINSTRYCSCNYRVISYAYCIELQWTLQLYVVAERLSARQLIMQRSHIVSVYIYPSQFNCAGQGAVASLWFLCSR